ncbi:MAG: DUF6399 domain-containing protein [Snowella sp.]
MRLCYQGHLTSFEQQQWIDWAIWMSAKFQRISSAVEGHNGYLSGLHHAGREFTQQTLRVLTIIHNFGIRRDDGTTAAQRLFGCIPVWTLSNYTYFVKA